MLHMPYWTEKKKYFLYTKKLLLYFSKSFDALQLFLLAGFKR